MYKAPAHMHRRAGAHSHANLEPIKGGDLVPHLMHILMLTHLLPGLILYIELEDSAYLPYSSFLKSENKQVTQQPTRLETLENYPQRLTADRRLILTGNCHYSDLSTRLMGIVIQSDLVKILRPEL